MNVWSGACGFLIGDRHNCKQQTRVCNPKFRLIKMKAVQPFLFVSNNLNCPRPALVCSVELNYTQGQCLICTAKTLWNVKIGYVTSTQVIIL